MRDVTGKCNYKYVNSEIIDLTDEEKEIMFPSNPIVPTELEKDKQDLKDSYSYLLKLSTLGIDEIKTLEKRLLETQTLLVDLQKQIIINNIK